jgi:DNA-binding XRE family transcriptional regulator
VRPIFSYSSKSPFKNCASCSPLCFSIGVKDLINDFSPFRPERYNFTISLKNRCTVGNNITQSGRNANLLEGKMPIDFRKVRRLAGCTQFQLANRTGISRVRLSLAETGQLRLRPEEKRAVLDLLLREVTRSLNELQKVRQAMGKNEDLPVIVGEPSEAETVEARSL